MDPTLESNRGPDAAAAAAASVAPDAETADLLQRHAAKQKLTPQEYGKLGAFAKARQFIFGKNGPTAGPAQPGTQTRNPAGVATLAPGEAPDGSMAPVTIDDGLAQRTTAALLRRIDGYTVSRIDREATAAGASGPLLDKFRTQAAFHRDDQKLLVEISPDICRELNIDPRKMALWTAIGVVGLHGLNIWECVQELRELKNERPATVPAQPTAATNLTPPATAAAPMTEAPLTAAAAGISVMAAPAGAVAPSNLPKRGVGPIATLQEGARGPASMPTQMTKAKGKK